MWPAVRPDILFLSFFLGLSMWAGRNGDRKQPPPPPSSLHPLLLPSFSASLTQSLTPHVSPAPPPPFSSSPSHLPPLRSCFFSPLSGPSFCCVNFPNCVFSLFFFFPSLLSWFACLPHPQACPCIITHLVLKCAEVC